VVLLAATWGATLGLVRIKHAEAEHDAATLSHELLGTYVAQVVRVLHEIDQTLNLVKFWHERAGMHGTLAELKDRGLLPSDLVFSVGIADRDGPILESTRPLGAVSAADRGYFRDQRDGNSIRVGHLPRGATGDGRVPFTRRLNAANGDFDGAVIVAVDAAFFVSGYDASKLGEHGVLGVLGTDGIFRVRRSGDSMFTGDAINYSSLLPKPDEVDADPPVSLSSWDGVRRWSRAREIYGFPLAILIGLAQDEQLAAVERNSAVYLWRAAAGSLAIVLFTALLGRMSWQLAQSRLRESESKLEHARRVEYLAYHDGLTGLPTAACSANCLVSASADAGSGRC
jgi:hypothetical protein